MHIKNTATGPPRRLADRWFSSYSGDCAAQSAVENGHLDALREPVTQMVDVALALHLGGTRAGSSLPSIGQTI
jgi:hypothetical protein